MPENTVLEINNHVPFGESIYTWCKVTREPDLDTLIRDSHRFDSSYLAWELVRKIRNPYFENGTGFEGYFVGICETPEQALKEILQLGHDMLNFVIKQYPWEYGFRTRLLKTLAGQIYDPQAILEWNIELGAELARLRCLRYKNPEAEKFHQETLSKLIGLPPISYEQNDSTLNQYYRVTNSDLPGLKRITVNIKQLKPAQQEAWLVVQSVGKFGHPLLREFARTCVD